MTRHLIARFSLIFALVFALTGAALCAAGGLNWFVNAFAAAIGSYFVAIASFASYKNMIEQAAKNYESGDRDDADENEKEDEKAPLKTRGFYAMRSFSPLRLAGYAALVCGFFALNATDRFAAAPFLVALGVLPFSALIFAVVSARSER